MPPSMFGSSGAVRPRSVFLQLAVVAAIGWTAPQIVAQAPSAATELQNGSFETIEDQRPAGWIFASAQDDAGFSCSVSTEQPFEGSASGQVRATSKQSSAGAFCNLMQVLDAQPFQGKTVRLRAAVRTAQRQENGRAQLWLRVDRSGEDGQGTAGAFDNMQDRPIQGDTWQTFEITARVADDATQITVGLLVFPVCTAWIDAVSLEAMESVEKTTAELFASQAAVGAAVTPPEPFWNPWLGLAGLAILLLLASQWGRNRTIADADNTDLGQAPSGRWFGRREFSRWTLRFAAAYWVLYSFPQPFSNVLFHWGGSFGQAYQNWLEPKVRWFGRSVLGIEKELVLPLGSGDTSYAYVQLLFMFLCAVAISVVWWLIDRRRSDDRSLNDLLRSYVRYVLAFTMLGYGIAKTFTSFNQFPPPDVPQLVRTYGESSPMGLVWTLMGASRAYTFFAGLAEVVAALSLIWRRTATLGALVAIGVMTNVALLNFCYDVPVKLYSSHLLLMALFLVVPDLDRLGRVLFWNRGTEPITLRAPYVNAWSVWLQRLAKGYLIVVGVGLPLYFAWQADRQQGSLLAAAPDWFGAYEVAEFKRDGQAIPPLLGDRGRWRRLAFRRWPWGRGGGPGPSDMLSLEMMDGTRSGGQVTLAAAADQFTCASLSPAPVEFHRGDDNQLELRATLQGQVIEARLRRVRREDFLLVNRGFHWINEVPFNR